tara:strand:- start:1037 stop:1390 length:354 start_codon:yes stop_codon:yes gene_type:complete
MVKLVCKDKNMILGEKVFIASSFFERLKGLMFDDKLGKDFDGMLIKHCNSIHTFFMNYEIDVLFLNRNLEVIKILREIKPWRITKIYFSASQVLELKGGSLSSKIVEGDLLEEVCIN